MTVPPELAPIPPVKQVCVMGLGYIGLPTATLMASTGLMVHGVDTNPQVVQTLSSGEIHIVEPDLEGLFAKVIHDGSLSIHTAPAPAEVFIIAVPTPINEDKSPNIEYVIAAGEAIAPHLKAGDLVIIESTSPVGTTHALAERLNTRRSDLRFPLHAEDEHDVHLAYCPERVLPGRIIGELMFNDRTIGGITPHCAEKAQAFYRQFVRGQCLITEAKTAELVKLSENAYRDVNIAFANELALVSEHHGLDVREVIKLANHHPRVKVLSPGPGVGGHCIPVDPWFIIHGAPEQSPLMRAAREVNDARPGVIVTRVLEAAQQAGSRSVALLGLSYKPDVDDLRESPAMGIAMRLAAEPLELYLSEPHIKALPENLAQTGARFCDALSAISKADIVLVLVAHQSFRYINPAAMQDKVLIDTVGLW